MCVRACVCVRARVYVCDIIHASLGLCKRPVLLRDGVP